MRSLALLATVALAGCAAEAAPVSPTPIHGVTPGHACQTAGTEPLIGKVRSRRTGEAILKATHAAVLRWAPPGVMLTMDFRADRATVYLGPDNRITQIKCM